MLRLSHKNLEVYKMSLQLIREVYAMSEFLPRDEQYVLISQMKRAALSVASNIAEGASRISKTEKKRFYEISRSSLVELDTQLEVSLLLEYRKNDQLKDIEQYTESVFRMLSKMIDNLKTIGITAGGPTSH